MGTFFKSDLDIDSLTVNDDVTIDGNLTVNGTTTTVSTTNTVIADKLLELANGTSGTPAGDAGIIIERGSSNNAAFVWDESADTFVVGTTTATGASTGDLSITDGALQAGSLDISGNIDVDGITNLDNTDIDGSLTVDGAIDLNATTLDVDASAAVTIDGVGVSIDSVGVAANFTVASDGAGEDLTIAVTGATDSSVVISSTGTGADAINIDTTAGSIDIDSADNITVGAADEISITTTSADGHISLVSAHTAGVALHVDADANAGSIVDVDAGILDVDVTGVASIDSGGTLSLATANSSVAVSIGHTTSETTVNDNLNVTGDLDITGGLSFDGGTAVTSIDADMSSVSGSDDTLASAKAIKSYIDSTVTAQDLDATGDSGTIAIDLDSETLTIAGGTGATTVGSGNGITVNVDAAQTGITSVINTSLALGRDADNQIKFATDDTIVFEVAGGDGVTFKASGEIEATSLDIEGDVDINGTSNLDNTDIDGTFQMDGATFDVNASGLVTVDGAGVSIDSAGVAANFTVASDGAGEDLTIAVTGATDSSVVISSTGTGADAINIDTTAGSIDIDSADNITIDAADEIVVTTTSADGHIALVSAHTAGVALHIDADADAGSIVDVDAGILDVDVTGAASIDSGGTLSLATANNGVAVSIGHTTSETTVNDNLTVTGDLNSSNGFIGYANGQNATLTVATTGGGTDGRDLTLEAGSAPTGSANQNGGDLSLKAGGGDGTGTSIMTFSTKVNGTDAVAERMRIHTDGNVGIGTNAPGNLLHVAGSDAYLLLQNTTAENGEGGAETRVLFGDHSGTGLAMIEASHSGTADDTKGKFIVSTNNGSAVTTAFTIDEAQKATFAGDVAINGDTTTFTSANSTDPVVQIKNTTNDANGARLQFVKDKGAAGAANDIAGIIEFIADDANQDQVLFGAIATSVKVHTNGQEGGKITIDVASHDGELQSGIIIQDGDAEDEIDVIIGNGTASMTTTAGFATATSGFMIPEAKSIDINVPLLPSTDHTATGLTAQMLAGGAIGAFQTVCIHTTTGEVVISDSSAIGTMPVIGIAPAAISDTATGTILLQGFIRDDTFNWTIGGIIYASETAGAMTQTAPTTSGAFVQALGVALSADVVYFNPALTLVEVA